MYKAISTKVQGKTHMWYVLKHIRSNFLNFTIFMWFWIFFTHTKLKYKSKIKNKTMHTKKMQDAQNAWKYDIECMKGPIKIERIRSRTKKSKSSTIWTLPHPNGTIVWNECLKRSETRVGTMRTGDAHSQGVKSIKHFL